MKDLTEYIQESILSSTNSGRASLPLEISEFYTPKECAEAIKDFCKYYQIKDRKLIVKIEKAINDFVKHQDEIETFIIDGKLQTRVVPVSLFRFVKDTAFKDKFFAQTEFKTYEKDIVDYFDKQKTVFLIIHAVFKNKEKLFEIIEDRNTIDIIEIPEKTCLMDFLKKYM